MDKLEACPFCGTTANLLHEPVSDEWSIMCMSCPATVSRLASPSEADQAWNRRTSDDERAAIVAYLRGKSKHWLGDGVDPYEDAAADIEAGEHLKDSHLTPDA